MDLVLYYLARAIVALLQALPLGLVAWLGRAGGALAHRCDARHRGVAERNIAMCFGNEKSPEEIRAIARENFRRIGENFACAVKTSAMEWDKLRPRIEAVGLEKLFPEQSKEAAGSRVLAIGHFGNFEIFAHAIHFAPGYQAATTYRALHNRALNRLLLNIRESSGCLLFERRTEGAALRAAVRNHRLCIGLFSDQHSGDHGVRIPFFGHDCTTTKAPAVFALRFNLPLHTAICYRTGPARWSIEIDDEIPTMENGQPRTIEAIMLEVNRAFEAAVRRDPANWFWVHRRWKPAHVKPAAATPADEAATSGAE